MRGNRKQMAMLEAKAFQKSGQWMNRRVANRDERRAARKSSLSGNAGRTSFGGGCFLTPGALFAPLHAGIKPEE